MLYIPDVEEIACSAPKSAPPNITGPPSAEHLPGSTDSQETLHSSSLSQPFPEDDPEQQSTKERLSKEKSTEKSTEKSGGEIATEQHSGERAPTEEPPGMQDTIASPLVINEDAGMFEEVEDTHMVLLSRYISDDQVSEIATFRVALFCVCRVVFMAT